MNKKVNYLFFGFFFLALLLLNIHHVTVIKHPETMSKLIYICTAAFQTILEFSALAFVAHLFKKRFSPRVYHCYIGVCFVFLILHLVDFLLVRFMSLSIWQAFDLMLGQTFENFVENLRLTGIPLWLWVAFMPLTLLLPLAGIAIYKLTARYNKHHFSSRSIARVLCICPTILLGLGLLTVNVSNHKSHLAFTKALPFKGTFLTPDVKEIEAKRMVSMPLLELEKLPKLKAKRMPNIYVFVAESIRADFFHKESAPHLAPKSQRAVAGANCTHKAWYSLFHANNSLTWSTYQRHNQLGALPLRYLKQMGYEIHCHSAANLRYYRMDELLFGKDSELLDSCNVFTHGGPNPAWQADEQALQSAVASLKNSGQVHIIFLDSTHFHYSWNPNFGAEFTPYSSEIHMGLTSDHPKTIERIQNRYLNSIAYVDHLVNCFANALEKRGLYKDAVIAFTGDHGEEFYEEGNLFHASDLSTMQCEVPLYLKLGTRFPIDHKVISHMDIMPTILEHVSGKRLDHFDGHSLLDPDKPQRALTVAFNGARNPYAFVCYSLAGRIEAELNQPRNIFKATKLKILSEPDDLTAHDRQELLRPYLRLPELPEEPHMDHDDAHLAEKN